MPTLVPSADRAPSLASRVVTVHATDVAEGAPAPDSFVFSLRRALRVPADDVILRPGGVRVRLVDGRGQIRLPVYSAAVQTVDGSSDWGIVVTPSWGEEYMIRVPAGTSTISLADLPEVRPLSRYEQSYAISGVGLTVKEGTQAGGTASYVNGLLQMNLTVPSFRPQTVYPYIDQTADTRAQHYEQKIRDDLDDRLREVTTAYELAIATGVFEGTIEEWLTTPAGIKGDKGDQGDDSTVPGPPNVLTIGTVTTGAAGSQAAATITGTSPAQVLGLTIPRGDKGEKGDASTVAGPTGKTAYEYAVDAGFTGTEQEFAEAQLPDTITWGNVDGKPTEYPPEAHSHEWADLTDPPAEFPPAAHTHTVEQVDGLGTRLETLDAATATSGPTLLTLEPGVTGNGPAPSVFTAGPFTYLNGGVARTSGEFDGLGTLVFTLPVGSRPVEDFVAPLAGPGLVSGKVFINTAGAVRVYGNSGFTYGRFPNISWRSQ